MPNHTIRFGSISLVLAPWRHSSGAMHWRASYYEAGKRRHLSAASLADAKAKALEKAMQLAKGNVDLAALPPQTIRRIRRMLDADPALDLVDEFLLWRSKARPRKNCQEAVTEFLAAKKANAGSSDLNRETLAKHLSALPDADLCDIAPADLPALTGAPRTRSNRRAAWVTFFRWAREMEYLPAGEKTAPERLEKPIVRRGIPATYSPAELRVLFTHVRAHYLPWLVLGAFAGIRTEEICPQHGSRKSPLMWEDFYWGRGIIIVRPETSKTGHRRVVPINAAIRAWLPQDLAGRVGPMTHPSKPSTAGALAETTRLGLLVGGWKRNALRHSFISYRAAEVGLAQTAMEAGNSESEARKSYNDAKGADEAADWFSMVPDPIS
jgi:integrase